MSRDRNRVSNKIRKLKREGKPQKQAVAQALNTVKRKRSRGTSHR